MIHKHTKLHIVDNSGASRVRCIHVRLPGQNRRPAGVGDLVRAAVERLKRSIPKKRVRRHQVVQVLVVMAASPRCRASGLGLKHGRNLGVLLNKDQDHILSNRIVSGLGLELRATRFARLLILASRVL